MKTANKIVLLLFSLAIMTACEDFKFGEAFLEKPLSEDVTIDTVFTQKKYADQALRQVYKSLPDFMPTLGGVHPEAFILDNYTDIGYAGGLSWVTGAQTSSSGRGSFPYLLSHSEITGDPTYAMRKAYIFLANIDKVVDMSDQEKKIRKAEVKVIMGLHYIQMFRFFGGVPWIEKAYGPDDVFNFPRMTVEETVRRTVALLDEAAADLPWYTTDEEYGHMTAAAAKALKFRVLLFAASPLFNDSKPYLEGEAADLRLTWYGDYSEQRWIAALEAGREFLRLNQANADYYKVINTGSPQNDYVSGYFVKGANEVILPSFRWGLYNKGIKPFRMYEMGYGCPRGNYADMFQWKDGSKFDWSNPTHMASPFFDQNGKPTRDVRLYETLLVNQDKWQGRKAEVYVGGREGLGTGSLINKKTEFGYGYRKFLRDKLNEMHNRPYSCPLIRMPEIYLSIAEVMNKLGKATEKDEFGKDAYDYLNLVHMRAGLPAVTSAEVLPGDDLWQYLMDERAREFGQEDIRYFDLVRYKLGSLIASPMAELVTKFNTDELTFEYDAHVRNDIKYMWRDAWYLMPFSVVEMNKKYGLVQNPGW